MNVLIIHADYSPRSLLTAMVNQAAISLRASANEVVISDLYSMSFEPVPRRRHLGGVKESGATRRGTEEFRTGRGRLPAIIEAEVQKLNASDALIFSFQLSCFGMPAILKGWCDRVLENSRFDRDRSPKRQPPGKRGMVLMTSGLRPALQNPQSTERTPGSILFPIQRGVFNSNGILPLEPFVISSAEATSAKRKEHCMRALDQRMRALFDELPERFPVHSEKTPSDQ